jgi:hypothetical protein
MSEQITLGLFDTCINHLSKPETKKKIKEKLIDPIVDDITDRYYYHFLFIVGLLIAIVALLTMTYTKINK